jgi:hypothetical protein
MRKLARRLAVFGVSMVTMVTVFGAPAHATTTNPFTGATACAAEFGGEWTYLTGGHKEIHDDSGTKVGDLYLLRDAATRFDCSVTIKRVSLGLNSWVGANLDVSGLGGSGLFGNFSYYAAVQRYTGYLCVKYNGLVDSFSTTPQIAWGNCGGL